MFEHKTIVDKNGNCMNRCVLFIDSIPQPYTLKESDIILDYCKENYLKPKWNGLKWIEDATEEEIKEWEEANKPANKEPTETEKLQKQLLETQAIVANLQEQILLNGGIK